MKLIDKDAVVAEIERRLHFDRSWIEGDERRQKRMTSISTAYYKRVGSKHAGEAFLDFVNTLEVEEVDWEKEVNDYFLTVDLCEGEIITENTFRKIAKHFFELGIAVSNKVQKGEYENRN